MNLIPYFIVLVSVVIALFSFYPDLSLRSVSESLATVEPVQLLVVNGRLNTRAQEGHYPQIWVGQGENQDFEESREYIESLAVVNGKFLAVGSTEYVRQVIDGRPVEKVIDLSEPEWKNRFIIPGFHDAHVHLILGGRAVLGVPLRHVKNKEEFVQNVRNHIQRHKLKKGDWILGAEWNDDHYPVGESPVKEWIDEFTADYPVYLLRMDAHSCLVNSKTLELASITRHTLDMEGGHIEKDPVTGEPTGILKDKAMTLVQNILPDLDDMKSLRAAMDQLAANGITSVTNMNYIGDSWKDLGTFLKARENGHLKARIFATTRMQALDELIEYIQVNGRGDDWVQWGALKEFYDGSLGSKTAYMFEPFVNTTNCGLRTIDQEELLQFAKKAYGNDIQMVIHAIGDRSNHELLNIIDQVIQESGIKKDHRFRIEHVQHLNPKDAPRFGDMRVIASVQPCHLIEDSANIEGLLGSERTQQSFSFNTLLNSGMAVNEEFPILALGTDWPVAELDPISNIYTAVTRKTNSHPTGFNPVERISVREALRAYTYSAAYASFNQNRFGLIKEGYLADLTILSQNILKIDADHIPKTSILGTVVGGKFTFTSTSLQTP